MWVLAELVSITAHAKRKYLDVFEWAWAPAHAFLEGSLMRSTSFKICHSTDLNLREWNEMIRALSTPLGVEIGVQRSGYAKGVQRSGNGGAEEWIVCPMGPIGPMGPLGPMGPMGPLGPMGPIHSPEEWKKALRRPFPLLLS